jgi:hypothetical protein
MKKRHKEDFVYRQQKTIKKAGKNYKMWRKKKKKLSAVHRNVLRMIRN